MLCKASDVALAIALLASCLAAPTSVRGDETTLAQPEMHIGDAESIATNFRLQQNLQARRARIAEAIDRKQRQKAVIPNESITAIGARPEFADNASSLKQDEFETKAEWQERVEKTRHQEKQRVEADQRLWDARKRQVALTQKAQLQEIDREIERLVAEQNDVEQEIKQALAEGGRDTWIIWRSLSPLTRYDMEKGGFPNLRCAASPVAEPTNQVLLVHGELGGRTTAMLATSQTVNGKKTYEIHASSREVAKTFKQDWADNKVLVASTCCCTPRSIKPAAEVVVSQAEWGTRRSAPNYGAAAFYGVLSILNAAAGTDPSVAQGAAQESAAALYGGQDEAFVVRERQAFTADVIIAAVEVGPPKFFRISATGKPEPYEGIECK